MIPISDNLHLRKKPIINYWLIGINIFLFFWEIKLEISDELGSFISTWGVVPSQVTTAINIALFNNPAAWVVVFYRLFSLLFAIFLHSSFSQILGNLLFLWVFGKAVENIFGHARFLAFYLACGIFTGILQIIVEPNLAVPLIGANGAIAAVLGAYIMRFSHVRIYTVIPLILIYIPAELPAYFYSVWWYIQQLFNGIGGINIPPMGANQFSLAYWMQLVGMLIGAAYMRKQ